VIPANQARANVERFEWLEITAKFGDCIAHDWGRILLSRNGKDTGHHEPMDATMAASARYRPLLT
jgi:hypothetical protein